MAGKLVMSVVEWLCHHIWFSDIAVALSIVFILSCILNRLTNKGPMLWPVLGILPSLFFHMNDIYDWGTRALIKAGGTFHYRGMLMGGNYGIMTVDPSNIEFMLKTRFKNFPKGNYYRERFHDLLGGGIFNVDHESWKEQRRIASSEMHSTQFVAYSFQTIQDLVNQKLLELTDKLAKSGDCIDLQEVLLRFTFDNICTAAFGIDPGCLALELPEVSFAKAFEEATELTLFRFMVPPFIWKSMKFFGVGTEKRLQEAVRVVHDFAEKTVADRRIELSKTGNLNKQTDLLSRIMAIGEHEEGEINEVLGHRESNTALTMKDLKKMVYLQAALSETLRLYPSVPVDFKEVVEDDVLPDGTRVKKGSRVLYSIFSMARMESIWGKDCMEFKPERWIKDGQFVSENQFKYPVFNAGPRLCIGKKFAFTQMKMVAASILMRYTVKVVEGHSVVPKMTTTLYMRNGLLVTLEPRLSLVIN
ncbi:Cytochrome P450 86B1 [Vitis vinifera]|uniref:Cytochrome P450 86B1 n=1 Tax=Vitis vinifera TaxID=29760 RepID=A0A438HEC7_VITVI|nr:Cytochrome P450 86B1 [Vitis vinifera]